MRYVFLLSYFFTSVIATGFYLVLWYNLVYWHGIGPWAVLKAYGAAFLHGFSWPLHLILSIFGQ